MAKAPTYNKAAVDKQLTKNGVVKPKAKALTHKLLKGHQKTDESAFAQDIVNFSAFAGMYSDGAHAVFTGRDGKTYKLQATGDRPRKYYLNGVETAWDEVKRLAGNQKIKPWRGMEMNEDGASDAERNPSIERDKYRNRHPGPSAADREKAQIDRDRKAGMNMDPMDILKRRKERAMWGESTSYEKDMKADKPVVVKGVKGAKSTPFTKKFKNQAAYEKWADSEAASDYEVSQVMNEAVAVVKGDTDAWTQGHVAGKKGKGTNPHKAGSKDAKEWDKGFNHAKKSIKESRNLTEGVLDDQDDDGFMAKRQLYDIAKYAVALHRMIQDTDNLEPWIQAKITTAADYIDTVKHYLEYSDVRDAEGTADTMGPPEMADIDDVGATLDTMIPKEEVMEYGDEDEGSEVYPEDVLRWASNRGVISNQAYDEPTIELMAIAQDVADNIGPVTEIGSSDISYWLRELVNIAQSTGIPLDGPKAHLYESEIKASAIYKNMLRELRGKK
jgi:hypothetical protein